MEASIENDRTVIQETPRTKRSLGIRHKGESGRISHCPIKLPVNWIIYLAIPPRVLRTNRSNIVNPNINQAIIEVRHTNIPGRVSPICFKNLLNSIKVT